MYRDVGGVDAGVEGQSDNPFIFEEVKKSFEEDKSSFLDEEKLLKEKS